MNNLLHKQAGFTLIELMIVVAIAGILLSLAYPAYISHVQRGYRVDAQTEILAELQAQSRWYALNLSYQANVVPLPTNPQYINVTSTCVGACQTVTVTANVVAGADPMCGSISMNNAGVQFEAGTAANAALCWNP